MLVSHGKFMFGLGFVFEMLMFVPPVRGVFWMIVEEHLRWAASADPSFSQ
jgi:type IV secretory pathway TrbD component